jgi:hypothetical protein
MLMLSIAIEGSNRTAHATILSGIRVGPVPWGNWSLAVIALLVCLAIALRLQAIWRKHQGHGAHQPRKLFIALCRAHQLDHAQQRLLALIAKSQQLPQPGTIFLRPDLLTPEMLGPQFSAHRPQVELLRHRLFGAGV